MITAIGYISREPGVPQPFLLNGHRLTVDCGRRTLSTDRNGSRVKARKWFFLDNTIDVTAISTICVQTRGRAP